MNEILSISKEISNTQGLDYALLKNKGLQYIEQLSGKLWTDYNTHDPGITMLELLCYAITDLNYRISMPVEDILTTSDDSSNTLANHFLSALNILPNAPVTLNDYRQLLIRIEGVRNVWLINAEQSIIANYAKQPVRVRYAKIGENIGSKEIKLDIKGLYHIYIEFDDLHETSELNLISKKHSIINNVKAVFHHFRNLCEDLVDVKEVPEQKFVICTDIELYPKADPEQVWAEIISNIELYLSPPVNFYSLLEMLEKGKTTEEIFEGPVFDFSDMALSVDKNIISKRGFIDLDEIKNSTLREDIRLSDLIKIITQVDGVKVINSLIIKPCNCSNIQNETISQGEQWFLKITPGYKPTLNIDNTVINFYKDVIPIELNKTEAKSKLELLNQVKRLTQLSDKIEDLPIPQGKNRNISYYSTIQNHFPDNYGINQTGLPDQESVKRKALAKQLKAYLLFFDQVLANYFSQLANVRSLLSVDNTLRKTYFSNAVKNIKNISDIFEYTPNWEEVIDNIHNNTGLDKYNERKNKFLDHLLARFSEHFNEYVFLLHRLYKRDYDDAIIRQKIDFYADYKQISTYRGSAMDYFNKKSNSEELENVSGLEKRITRFLGFNTYKRLLLSEQPYEIKKETDSNGNIYYSWKIFDKNSTLLTGTGNTPTEDDAWEEMGLAIILGNTTDNYQIYKADNKFHFDIINSDKRILAHSFKKYTSINDARNKIDIIKEYLQNGVKIEGIYVIEHILLRPTYKTNYSTAFLPICITPEGNYCKPLDPYTYRVTIVLPGYTMRLRNMDFRKYVEKIIRLETPAHILPKICFIGQEQMKKFEKLYFNWLKSRKNSLDPDKQVGTTQLYNFISLLENLYSVYPEGQLTDCNDDTKEVNPMVLGQTFLGTLDIGTDDNDNN